MTERRYDPELAPLISALPITSDWSDMQAARDEMQGMIETMLTPVMKAGDGSIGLGFFLNGEGTTATFSHGGGNEGFKCHLSATREGGRGVAIMTNSDRGQSVIAGAFKAIREHYREHHNWPK